MSAPSEPENLQETALEIRVLAGMQDVSADAWDACAGLENPFISHAFLKALEDSS